MTRLEWLALACFCTWSAGAALTHVIGIWAGIGGAAIGLGIATLVFARATITPLLRPSGTLLAWGLAAAMLMVAATYGLYPLARRESVALAGAIRGLYAVFHAGGSLWVSCVMLPLVILAEELIWRGVVLEALLRRLTPALAVLLGAAVYAAAHAPVGSALLTALAFTCGLFWSTLRVGTRSLVPCLISHLVWDFLVFVFRPLA